MKKHNFRRWLSSLLVLAMILSCLPVTLAAEEDVVVRYTFDDGTAADSSGNGYDGTLVQGATVADGSVKLTGGNKTAAAGVDIPTAAFTGLTDYTIEMDVKLDETVKWTQLFTMGNGSNYLVLANQGDPSGVQVGLTMAAKLNGGAEERVKSTGPDVKLPVGEWARMTYTQSGNTAALYINGVQVGTNTITITPAALAEKGLYGTIGRSLMFPDPGMKGLVDEFVVYNYGMTASQVKESYDAKFGPILYYDFEDVTDGTVKDVTGNGYDATLTSGAAVTQAMDGNALSLTTGDDYLSMPDFLEGLTDVTFSGFVKLDQRAIWTTIFAAGVQNGKCITVAAQGNPARNAVGFTLAINNGAGTEQRIAATSDHCVATGEWVHFVYTQEGSSAKLYLDGVEVGSLFMVNNSFVDFGDNMTNTFGDVAGSGGPLMLGKSVWPDPDAYGLFDEIKIYDRALSQLEIQAITDEFALKIAYDALDLGDLSRVTSSLTLPEEGAKGTTITWESDNPDVMDATGKLSPNFEGQQTVTLTATISLNGQSIQKIFVVNVHPLSEEERAQLLLDEEVAYIEAAIDFLINDGYTLPTGKTGTVVYTVAEGDAVIRDGKIYKTETSAERQALTLTASVTMGELTEEVELNNITLIDPYVGYILSFFGANGAVDSDHSSVNNKDEKFRMAYSYDGIHWAQLNNNYPVVYPEQGSTKRVRDPFIMRNKDGSFSVLATQGWDTPYIYIWHSENLTEFTNERLLQVSQAGVEGLTGSRAWAPEADYDRITDQYYIYWADPSAGPIYYNTSTDLETVSDPAVYFDPGYAVIDSNIVKDGDTYYMAFKDERGSGKRMKFAKSNSLQPETWEVYTPDFVTGMNSEGPFVFQDIVDGKWVMYYDFFYASGDRFGYSFTDDLASGQWEYQGTNPYMPSDDVRHGGVIPVTQKELDAVIAKWETTTVRNVVQAAENSATVEGPAPFDSLTLPETAKVYLDNGLMVELPVTWSSEGYEVKLGQQQLSGTILLPEGYTNTNSVTALLDLTVIPDTQVPVITGVTDGAVYCEAQVVTIVDNNLASVTVNGEAVSLVGGSFMTNPGVLTIVATDLAGNTATVTITVTNGHSYADTVVEPTCTQAGYTSHVCSNCGYSYISDLVAAKGHTYTDVVTEPTHDMMGYTTHTCACGHSYIDSFVAALEHEYTQTVTREPTCTENGELTFSCQCGESYTMILPRLDHSYTAQTVEAACQAPGYTVYTCQCGHSYVGDLVPAKGHTYESVVTEPTCTTMGYTTHTCDCGSTYVDALTPALGHDYESVVTEPTHEKMGYTTHTCACGHSYMDTYTDALDHDYVQTVTKEATCTENGELTFTCQCGESYTMVIPKADHSYTDLVTEPTHTTMGYTTHTCSCGHSYVDGLTPALGHSHEAVVTEPTCVSWGYTTYTCSCGDSFVDGLTPALGHSHEAVVTEPTCVSWGYTTYTCACGDNYVSSLVPALGHSYESVVTEPTCESMGYTTHTCSACGDSYVDSLVELLPHSYVGTVTTEPTCTAEGVMTYTCQCGESYTQPISKADHVFDAVVTQPQCGLYGYTTYTCVECGLSYVSDMTPALDCPSLVFTDVITGTWYHEGLDYVISRDIMRGVSLTEFDPHGETTRAMLATILYRVAGEPSVETLANPFTDVAQGRYYTDAVIWAASVGVVKGVTEDTFAPDAAVTREQLVTMLYRFAGEPETQGDLSRYTDAGAVSPYARKAMAWAVENGIITGDTRTTLNPTGTATRAMIATVLMRYLTK